MIFRSSRSDIAIPETALTPFVLRHAARLGDKTALIDGVTGRTLTYGQLATAIDRTAAGLAARGFKKGEVFAIYAPNCLEYAVAFHAAVTLGGVVTTINPAYTVDELAHQLADAGASYLLTAPDLMGKASAAALRAGIRDIFVLGEAPGGVPFASLAVAGHAPVVTIDPHSDLAALPYSSGTTGLPKGVMLTHANLVANMAQVIGCGVVSERDTVIAVLPFFHVAGLMAALHSLGLATGATLVTLPRFELELFLRTLETYGVTFAHLVPPIVLALAKQPVVERYDLSRLKLILCGAAPLGADIVNRCRERVGCHVIQGYGLTEASPATHVGSTDPRRTKVESIGQLLPNTVGKIVDPVSGAEIGPDEQGELWIRGPQVMKGYLNRAEATAQTVTPDGWLRTGDLGYADHEGNFYIVDRLKELIKYRAFQVAPAELEAVLLSHPAVADAAVIPSPDEEAGEVPKAFVVLKSEATPEELMAFVAERVAPYKKVRRLEFIDEIPRSASGKILRRVLVERERAAVPVLV